MMQSLGRTSGSTTAATTALTPLDWTGRVASANVGHTSFDHSFIAHVTGVRFDSVKMFDFDAVRMRDYFRPRVGPLAKRT